MIKLKTIKDFDWSEITESKNVIPNIIKGELKQEAIKWIKDFNQREENIRRDDWVENKLPVYIDDDVYPFADSGYDEYSSTAFGNVINWIKHFFNIEEKDLNETEKH